VIPGVPKKFDIMGCPRKTLLFIFLNLLSNQIKWFKINCFACVMVFFFGILEIWLNKIAANQHDSLIATRSHDLQTKDQRSCKQKHRKNRNQIVAVEILTLKLE
jgi:hypothetical protein